MARLLPRQQLSVLRILYRSAGSLAVKLDIEASKSCAKPDNRLELRLV